MTHIGEFSFAPVERVRYHSRHSKMSLFRLKKKKCHFSGSLCCLAAVCCTCSPRSTGWCSTGRQPKRACVRFIFYIEQSSQQWLHYCTERRNCTGHYIGVFHWKLFRRINSLAIEQCIFPVKLFVSVVW